MCVWGGEVKSILTVVRFFWHAVPHLGHDTTWVHRVGHNAFIAVLALEAGDQLPS